MEDEVRLLRSSALILSMAAWRVCGDVGVGGLVEADVAVADLDEREVAPAILAGPRRLAGCDAGTPAAKLQTTPGSGPLHAFQEAAPIDAVLPVGPCAFRGHIVFHEKPFGWRRERRFRWRDLGTVRSYSPIARRE